MKTVTVEQFKRFGPCWLETREGRERFAKVAALHDEWTAYDVLALPDVSAEDKLWAVLREEFIDAPVLHEYACRCAEYALSMINNPDPRSVAAIEAKRKWMRCEIDDVALAAARDAAKDAANTAALPAVREGAWAAACATESAAALAATLPSARAVAWATELAAAWDAREKNLDILTQLLNETYGGKK